MSLRPRLFHILFTLGLALGCAGATMAQTSNAGAGASLTNTAKISFKTNGLDTSIASNAVSLPLQAFAPRTINLMRLARGGAASATLDSSSAQCRTGGGTVITTPPATDPFDPTAVALQTAPSIHVGEALFIDVSAPDANLDPGVRDRLNLVISTSDGDSESLSIQETAPNSGRFVGFIDTELSDAPTPGDCRLSTLRNRTISVRVIDPLQPDNPLTAQTLVDPYGYLFKSADGELVNGAQVTLMNDATGQPAQVLGDDGVSIYPSTVISGQGVADSSGAHYTYAAGQYRFPRVAPGRYHLKTVAPQGLEAPSSAPMAQIAKLRSPTGDSFTVADASYGKSFTLVAGQNLNADIPVDGQASGLSLDKTASATDASVGDFVQYRLAFHNRDAANAASGVTVTDNLPRGFRYVKGSSHLNGARAPDPGLSTNGRTLTYALGPVPAGTSGAIDYVLSLTSDVQVGDAVNRAQATAGGGLSSNVAQATVHVRPALYTDRIGVIGRVTEGDCNLPEGSRKGVRGVRVVMQDGTYTVTDADGLYHFAAVPPGLHVVQLDTASLPQGLEAKSCGQTTRRGGSDISQFVDGQGGALVRADFQLRRTGAGPTTAASTQLTEVEDTRAAGEGIDWFAGGRTETAWLFPQAGYNPRAPTTRVAIAHLPKQHVELTLNGGPVDPFNREGDDTRADGGLAVTLWRGVPLKEGDNLLAARITGADGKLVAELTRKVHYANRPVHAQVIAARSNLAADGLTTPTIAVRFTDAAGAPIRSGVMGSFAVAAPYGPAVDVGSEQQRKLDGQAALSNAWRIKGDDGVALIALAPTTRAGEAVLDLPLPGDSAARPTQVRAWLKADRAKWIVVGFAAGTAGFNTLSRHADPLTRTNGRPDMVDGQLAFYAKGRVKGEWLLTLAYDSNHVVDRERGLAGGVDPDRDYTVYGDATTQGYDAQSQRKLYIRLERRAFYALFGDFQTGFDSTELGRYSRTLNGLKFERQGRVLSFAGFAADTAQTHVRDEIQGSGISGPYRLSNHDLVVGSEQIVIETRDRIHAERVLTTHALTLHADYDIDYQTGELSFSAPVLSHDAAGNPNVIVAQYEVDTGGKKALSAGGRATARLADGRLVAGVTYLHDSQGGHAIATNLVAADLKLRPRTDTEIRLEAAVSDRDALGQARSQTAYVAEVEHHSATAEVLGYYRQQDLGFGVGQQALGEAGAFKAGAEGKLHLTSSLSLSGSGWHERYMATGATRDAVDARLDWLHGNLGLNLGLKIVHDDTAAAGQADSRLLTVGGSEYFLNHKLQLTVSNDFSLDGKAASLDFPVRHRIGAAYDLRDNLRLSISHEIDEGAQYRTQTTTAGVDFSPWKGAKATTGLGEQGFDQTGQTSFGPRTFGQARLIQSLVSTKQWSVDASVDTSTTISGRVPTLSLVNPAFPSATGATSYSGSSAVSQVNGQDGAGQGVVVEDFKAVSLGAAYHAALWSWTGRAEARFGSTADTWNLAGAYLRQLREGVTAVVGLRASDTRTVGGAPSGAAAGAESGTTSLEGALAWRPLNNRWSVLDRLELRYETATGTAQGQTLEGFGALAASDGTSGRVVNNFVVNYDTDTSHGAGGMQASLYYGAKYVSSRFDGEAYDGFVNAVGLQAHYNLTEHLDVGFNGAVQHAWSAGTFNFTFGPSIGVSPAANTWISVGWNVVGFRDRDFEANGYTRQGPYVTARLKFDQQSLGSFARLIRGGR